MSVSGQGFAYSPLDRSEDSFRLVKLLPSEDDELHCQITVESIKAQRNQYVAISYTWGSESGKTAITLNSSRFPVRENLHALLLELHKRQVVGPLWIDSICINQTSVKERNRQVTLMARIFGGATCVYAWLGQAANDSDWLLRFLEHIRSSADVEHVLREHSSRFLTALERFAQRTYWRRIWIVQELVLARNVKLICGSSTLCWRRVEEFFTYPSARRIKRIWESDLVSKPHLTTISRILEAKNLTSSFLQLFEKFATKDCSVQHDKVYARLGMDQQAAPYIPLEYSCPIFEVLRHIVVNWEHLDHASESSPLDFTRKFIKHLALSVSDYDHLTHADELITFGLAEMGRVAVTHLGETIYIPECDYSLSQHQDEARTPDLNAVASSLGASLTGDVLFRLSQDLDWRSLIITWPSPGPGNLDKAWEIDGKIMGIGTSSADDFRLWQEVKLSQYHPRKVILKAGFYALIRLALSLSVRSEVSRDDSTLSVSEYHKRWYDARFLKVHKFSTASRTVVSRLIIGKPNWSLPISTRPSSTRLLP